MDDYGSFFWDWLEHVDRALDWEVRTSASYAWEVMGASKRQERLEFQRGILKEIGEAHEQAARDSGHSPYDEADTGAIPHQHGGNSMAHSTHGEECKVYPAGGCQYNQFKLCPSCDATPGKVESCNTCDGRGKVLREPTPRHTHPEPGMPYQEQSEVVHKLADGWSIKRCKSYGDLRYEGNMMNHCISEDAEGKECDECEGSGECRHCGGEGRTNCEDCGGEGRVDCDSCSGDGQTDCHHCETIAEHGEENCHSCLGKGEVQTCKGCGYGVDKHELNKKFNPTLDNGQPNTHMFESKVTSCGSCDGKGKVQTTNWVSGQIECPSCDGSGSDGSSLWDRKCHECSGKGHVDCDECGGEGSKKCEDCGGEGRVDCGSCEGGGHYDCDTCEGSGQCQNCSGTGTDSQEAGPLHYYHAFSQEEADHFNRAPGGPLSLRDADNVPSVSFLEDDHDSREINNVFGRGDEMPVAPHQHRILQYMRAQLPKQDALPGIGEKCTECKGTAGHPFGDDFTCANCKGTGKPTVGVKWATHYNAQRFTADDLDSIQNGSYQRPDVMLLAQHRANKNEIHTFKDYDNAKKFGWSYSAAGGTVLGKNLYDLHAIPSSSIGKDQTIYNPAEESYEVKSGRGAKLPLGTATKIPWDSVHVNCSTCDGKGNIRNDMGERSTCPACEGEGFDHKARDAARSSLPEYAQDLFPRVASKELSGWK